MAANGNQNRKNESIRRANRVIQTRTFVLMLIMGIGMFVVLFFKLYSLQITRHEELQAKAVSQQTRSSVVTANRGSIYDASGNILAISSTAETIFLSPKEINDALNDEENPVAWTKEVLAAALAKILDVSEEGILKKMARSDSMYEVLKYRVEEDVASQVRQYINDNKVKGVFLTTDAKRYYPYGSLAAQVIGFVGDDNTGLYGLEAYYEKELEGQSGLVISSKDQAENDMLYTYEQYFAAKNGSDLTLTYDGTGLAAGPLRDVCAANCLPLLLRAVSDGYILEQGKETIEGQPCLRLALDATLPSGEKVTFASERIAQKSSMAIGFISGKLLSSGAPMGARIS